MLVRREVLEDVGLLDEAYFFSFEDLELCLRARRAGWKIEVLGGMVAYHQGSASMGYRSPDRIYYGTRNHLLLARRQGKGPWRLATTMAFNLAHACFTSPVSKLEALGACLTGARDYSRGRFGPRETGSS